GWTAISQDTPPSETEDLVRHLSHLPDSSFLVTVLGDSMVNAGINDGDLLLVDKDEEATHGRIVLAHHNDKMTVKRLHIASDKTITLKAENPDHNNEVVKEGDSFEVIATVVSVIRRF
ncbi:MAG: LexA family protein, partial [Cyanophyceae cyanobacterium]